MGRPKTAPVSYETQMLFDFAPGRRRARSVAMSDNLLTMVEHDGTARSLRFVADVDDPSRASITYASGDAPEFTLLEGQVGPVWATFHNTATHFRRKAFPDLELRWMRAVIVLIVAFMAVAGTWSVMAARSKTVVHVESETFDAPASKWDL
jgi:hypothetical protein